MSVEQPACGPVGGGECWYSKFQNPSFFSYGFDRLPIYYIILYILLLLVYYIYIAVRTSLLYHLH